MLATIRFIMREVIDRVKIIENMHEGQRELTTLRVVLCVIVGCSVALPLHAGCKEILQANLSTEVLIKGRIATIQARMDIEAEEFRKATAFILDKPVTARVQ